MVLTEEQQVTFKDRDRQARIELGFSHFDDSCPLDDPNARGPAEPVRPRPAEIERARPTVSKQPRCAPTRGVSQGFIWRRDAYDVCKAIASYTSPASTCDDMGCFVQGEAQPLYPESSNGSLILFNSDVVMYWNVTDASDPRTDDCVDKRVALGQFGRSAEGSEQGEAVYWTERFANDEQLFKDIFAETWQRLIVLGNDLSTLRPAVEK